MIYLKFTKCALFLALGHQLLGVCSEYFHYNQPFHDDIMTRPCVSHYWSHVRGIHRPSLNTTHKGLGSWIFDVLFVVSHNKLLNKHLACPWFEMLYGFCDGHVMQNDTALYYVMISTFSLVGFLRSIIGLEVGYINMHFNHWFQYISESFTA